MYKISSTGWPVHLETGVFVNPDTNADYLAWLAEGNTPEPADPLPLPDMEASRAEQYRLRSDPLFFKWQRGTATKDEWLAEIAAIKAEFPDPVSP